MKLIALSSVVKSKHIPIDKVSVIVTNFKKEPYLKSAILSCLNQSHRRLEVIVVDDCSNKTFCKDLVKSIGDKRVRLLSTSVNYGHYACSNYAVDKAKGDYITFLGADDTMGRDHIRNLLKAIKLNRLVAAFSLYSRFKKDGGCVRKNAFCEASILFRKKSFVRDIGYFHMIRCAADTEYRERAIAFYGKDKLGLIATSSYKALWLPDSLTSRAETKANSADRQQYVKMFRKMHKEPKAKLRFDYRKGLPLPGLAEAFLVKSFDPKSFKEEIL